MTLLGVTWIFGIFAVGDVRLLFQYAFSVANSLQGFIIFMVRCVQYPEARRAWGRFLRTGELKRSRGGKTRVTSTRHTSSSSQTRGTISLKVGAERYETLEIKKKPINYLMLYWTGASRDDRIEFIHILNTVSFKTNTLSL